MTFPPRLKCRNQQNQRFRHGGKTENGKKYVSATAEKRKTVKNMFPPRRKCGNRQNQCFRHGGNTKKWQNQCFRHGRSIFSNQFLFFIMMINPNLSIDRGVVLLSKNMSFPTANDRLGLNLGTIFASNKHKKYVSIMKRILPFMTAAVGMLSSCSTTLTSFYTEDVNTYNRE